MNVFEAVKTSINTREAAARYGVEVNRHGKALCPFHNDRHPSLFVDDDHYHCYACGEHGDVIDFTAKLYGLSLYDAAKKLAYDFGITQDKPPTKAMQEKQNRKSEAQRLREHEKLCFSALLEYMKLLQEWKRLYAPRTPEEKWHPHFIEACDRLDYVEYLVDTLISGDSYERNAVIELVMSDGKLKKLQEYAKQFYADAYKAAVEIVGGEQYILSAVMHADERNRAMSEALGKDVYHYHLHVVYIPVVEKQILWSKRCKDEALRGTVKETITQVSRSKKWDCKPVLDENGNPMINAKGKKILKSSYSVLQDDFFNFMRAAGYDDVERGERGSTEEHLTVTQFKVQAEQQRLEAVTGQVAQAEQSLADAKAATEKQKKKLEALQKETKAAKTIALTVQDIEGMGKKNALTGNVSLTQDQCDTLKRYAVNGIIANADNQKLKEKLASAEKTVSIWKKRYEDANKKYQEMKQKAQPFMDALEIASEKVWAFINSILARGKETRENKHPVRRRGQDMEI